MFSSQNERKIAIKDLSRNYLSVETRIPCASLLKRNTWRSSRSEAARSSIVNVSTLLISKSGLMEKYQSIGKHEVFACQLNAEHGIYVRVRVEELKSAFIRWIFAKVY